MPEDLLSTKAVDGNLLSRLAALEERVRVIEENLIAASPPNVTYSISALSTDRTYNCDTALVAELCDIVGTLITDLGLV